jgi:putative DNA primase/helicase
MVKLDRVFHPAVVDDRTPEQQLIDAIAYEGINPPSSVTLDGKIHRFRSDASKAKNGWYIAYSDGRPAGHFGCWRRQIDVSWRAEGGPSMTPAEEIAHAKRMAEMRAIRDAELARQREVVAEVVEQIWSELPEAPADHPYLQRKGVKPHGSKVTSDGKLVVPLFDVDGGISSLQYIEGDGGKRYHPGGEVKGKFWMVGKPSDGVVYLAEGFATAATIHEVTGRPCVIAYSASNLVDVAGLLVGMYGNRITIVADNDKGHVGLRAAEQAIAKHGGRYVIPPTLGDANDYVQAGKDLNALLTPSVDNGWLIPADDFASQPAPIAWLVKGWLQAMALIMVHGPSGGGKTFLVLDWCLRMAAGMTEWHGVKVKPGPVVYLAGEGHHGLRKRVAAWKVKHQAGKLAMWLSRDGLNLNTVDGLAKTQSSIKALNVRPSLIVVDTLHRFLSGDENSAQDAKTMLDACAQLQSEFSCSVLLVHHTGVNEDAQGRARGSSAWRGALDIEVSVVPAKGDGPIGIVQRKSKDSEMVDPVYAELVDVPIPGWLDEDGEQVTGAVLCEAQAPLAPVKETPAQKHRKTAERAWWASGAEVRAGAPYISRAGLKAFLAEEMGWAPGTLAQHLKPSAEPGKFLRDLLDGGFFATHEHGWVISDPIRASALMLSRGSGN